MMMNGQMQQVMIQQQAIPVTAAAQNMAVTQPGQCVQMMIEQQPVQVTVNGRPMQMTIAQMPVTVAVQKAQGSAGQKAQGAPGQPMQIMVQPQQITLWDQQMQQVVCVILQELVQIIVILPQQVAVMQQVCVYWCWCEQSCDNWW
jgi:hypothetical protein